MPNGTYPKVAVQWLNQALYFYQSLCLVDSEVLRNRHLRVAAKRYLKNHSLLKSSDGIMRKTECMSEIKNINLEFSCPEEPYRTNADRLFCDKCAHELIDFRDKTNDELQDVISKSLRPLCGVFRSSQLSDHFIKYAVSTIIVTSSLSIPTFGQERIKSDSLIEAIEKIDKDDEEQIIFGMVMETQAEPIGGYAKFFNDLAARIKYPPGLESKGKTFVEFSIDTAGRMSEIRIVKGFNENADKEVVRALTSLNYPFKPGRQRDKTVKTRLVIPILFNPESSVKR